MVVAAMFNPQMRAAVTEKGKSNEMEANSPRSGADEICLADATTLAELLKAKKLSAVEVMKAHLKQIGRVKTWKVNAIVTLVDEENSSCGRRRRTMRLLRRATGWDRCMACQLA